MNREEDEPSAITAAKVKAHPINALSFDNAATAISAGETGYTSDPVFLAKDAFLNFFKDRAGDTFADLPTWISTVNSDSSLAANVRTELLRLINAITAYALQPSGDLKITINKTGYETFFGTGSSGKRHETCL